MDRGLLPDSATAEEGVLALGGCRLDHLAAEFGTPLYVYDEETLQNAAARALAAFQAVGARVSYAAKACALVAVLAVFRDAGLDLDVVSAGELEAARRAGFRAEQVHLHGNCKSDDELRDALLEGLHAVVVDNAEELERLASLSNQMGTEAHIHLRLRLPVEAETHPHLRTAGESSKFGIPSRDAIGLVVRAGQRMSLTITGLHAHVGSQICDPAVYGLAVRQLLDAAVSMERVGTVIREIGVGGGWAVAYAPNDPALSPAAVAHELEKELAAYPGIRPAVEPGRALVARAGVAVYRVGSVKPSSAGRIVAVDGGMGDNPRPALYGSRYHALLPGRLERPPTGSADVVGRYCESGDILARGVPLPDLAAGDLLAIPVSGAYQLSMASTYNLVPQPAAVLVRTGNARLILRRATLEDLFAREVRS